MLQFSGRSSTEPHRIKNKHLAAMSEDGSQPKSMALLASWRKCDDRRAKSLCRVIGADMLPVTVEGEGFKKLVRFLELKYLMPQRAAETKHVEKHWGEEGRAKSQASCLSLRQRRLADEAQRAPQLKHNHLVTS